VLSAGEKHMLIKSRQIIVSELSLAQGSSEADAIAALDAVLAATIGTAASGLAAPVPAA
jgi:RNA polymerase-interacting CarD/CdnL/TRCF family regulator